MYILYVRPRTLNNRSRLMSTLGMGREGPCVVGVLVSSQHTTQENQELSRKRVPSSCFLRMNFIFFLILLRVCLLLLRDGETEV